MPETRLGRELVPMVAQLVVIVLNLLGWALMLVLGLVLVREQLPVVSSLVLLVVLRLISVLSEQLHVSRVAPFLHLEQELEQPACRQTLH